MTDLRPGVSTSMISRLPERQVLLTCPYDELAERWRKICLKWPDPKSWQRQVTYDVVVSRNQERVFSRRAIKRKERPIYDPGTFSYVGTASWD